jgi:glutamate racemase
MEPAVKPAVEKTHTGSVGVLATPATFQGKLYNSVVERFAKNVKIYQNTCKGLVQEIEKGNLNGKTTRKILSDALEPMIEKGIDTVVLGCTHYPFVIPAIEDIVGPNITVIDPSPAIANQTLRKINEYNIQNESIEAGKSFLITTGSLENFQIFVDQVDLNLENIEFLKAFWSEDNRQINFIQE